ncbi:MAG: hypothetical protein H6Q04_1004 [Acidobacteria bacterium]|nr:hypothetical protein [Acidobacteriota bacterium]
MKAPEQLVEWNILCQSCILLLLNQLFHLFLPCSAQEMGRLNCAAAKVVLPPLRHRRADAVRLKGETTVSGSDEAV